MRYEFIDTEKVMDNIEGCEEEEMWMCFPDSQRVCGSTQQPVSCNGQENTQEYLMQRFRSIMEGVNRACDDALEDHEWVSERTISRQETEVLVALNYDIEAVENAVVLVSNKT